jgi:hypothetical protein
LAVLFCFEGYVYWRGSQSGAPLRCVYADAGCSLTVATWILSGVTILILLAAVKAAKEAVKAYRAAQESLETARRTLNFERLPMLAERECSKSDHDAPQIEWWISGELLDRSKTQPKDIDFDKPPRRHDFFNLGRAPLINPMIGVNISSGSSGGPRQYVLELPSIPTGADVHVAFHIQTGIGQVEMTFHEVTEDEQAGSLIVSDTITDDPRRIHFFSQRRSEAPEATVSLSSIKATADAKEPAK